MIRHLRYALVLSAAALMLAACSEPEGEDQPVATPAPTAPADQRTPAAQPAPTSAGGQTVGGDGSQIQLSGLSLPDQQANSIEGELSCYFRTNEPDPLLVASGFSDMKNTAAQGLVKVTGYVERIAAPGGFDGMVNGATFTGQGKTVIVKITGPATGGGESPPSPASLTYQRADGAERVFVGTWTCGP